MSEQFYPVPNNMPMPSDSDRQAFTRDDVELIESFNEPLRFSETPQAHTTPDARAAEIFLQAESTIKQEQLHTAALQFMLFLGRSMLDAQIQRSDLGTKGFDDVTDRAVEALDTKRSFEAMTADLPDHAEDMTIAPMARAALHMARVEPRIKQEVAISDIAFKLAKNSGKGIFDVLKKRRNGTLPDNNQTANIQRPRLPRGKHFLNRKPGFSLRKQPPQEEPPAGTADKPIDS